MSLQHILLGMLAEPHSGYDIKKAFDKSLRNFWNAELSQIYPRLKKMESDGLLTSNMVASASGPPRRVYRRTSTGRDQLMSWLAEGPVVGEERISYLAQVFFLGELTSPEAAIDFLTRLRDHMTRRLETLQRIQDEWRSTDPRYPDDLPDEDFYPQLTLDLGLRKFRANIIWCNECVARIRLRANRGSERKQA